MRNIRSSCSITKPDTASDSAGDVCKNLDLQPESARHGHRICPCRTRCCEHRFKNTPQEARKHIGRPFGADRCAFLRPPAVQAKTASPRNGGGLASPSRSDVFQGVLVGLSEFISLEVYIVPQKNNRGAVGLQRQPAFSQVGRLPVASLLPTSAYGLVTAAGGLQFTTGVIRRPVFAL